MLLSAGTRLGPYEIDALLGIGGMGEVYRARDTRLDRTVAIKISNAQFSERFEREARAVAALNHPHICTLYDVGPNYLVMEYIEGPTLTARIAVGAIPIEEALPLAHQIAQALEAAHAKGIVHRDLKPANIKLTADGQAKVLDFSLAKAVESDTPAANPASSPTLALSATRDGVILGTARYMSPEQARGLTADKRADIWAFGVVVLEMLTGRTTFAGDTISDTLASVLKTDPDWSALPPRTPPAIRRLLRRTLERDRNKRLHDIADARLEIEEALTEPADLPVPALQPKRYWLPWALTALLLLSTLLAVGLLYFREQPPEAPPLRLSVALPEKASANSLALSPDGRSLALALRDGTGKTSLWIRPLDSFDMQPLPGTENASLPFWSPDSRQIGFFAGNKLKRINLAGGLAQIICESGPGRGGTWISGDVILFARQNSGILRVPAGGGEPQEATQLDHAHQESRHYWPWVLPDGRRFLFTVLSTERATGGIWIASLEHPKDRRRLIGDQSRAIYAAGRLLFVRNGLLMAQPFDADRGELKDEAFAVAENVGSSPTSGRSSVAVSDNGSLAYLSRVAATNSEVDVPGMSHLTWLDRSGRSLAVLDKPAIYLHAALSPDQSRIAADIQDQQGNWDVWVLDPARANTNRLTSGHSTTWYPAWSPDGTYIAYSSASAGDLQLFRKLASGAGQEEILSQSSLAKFCNDWSPDGRYLLYSQIDPKSFSDIWVLPLTGERKSFPFLQTQFDERDGKFSPDGQWIAYVADELSGYEVWVQSFPAGKGKWQISTSGGIAPCWRRDGRELYYLSSDGKLMAVDVKPGPSFQAGAPHALFETHGAGQFAAAADGRKFLLTIPAERTAEEPVHVMLNWTAVSKK